MDYLKRFKVNNLGNDLELYIPRAMVEAWPASGPCDDIAEHDANILSDLFEEKVSTDLMLKIYRVSGLDDEPDRETLIQYILWFAVCNVREELHENGNASSWTYLSAY